MYHCGSKTMFTFGWRSLILGSTWSICHIWPNPQRAQQDWGNICSSSAINIQLYSSHFSFLLSTYKEDGETALSLLQCIYFNKWRFIKAFLSRYWFMMIDDAGKCKIALAFCLSRYHWQMTFAYGEEGQVLRLISKLNYLISGPWLVVYLIHQSNSN